MHAGTNLLGSDGVLPYPANKGESRNGGEKKTWNNVVRKAAYENHEEELQPSAASLRSLFLFVQCPAIKIINLLNNYRKKMKK